MSYYAKVKCLTCGVENTTFSVYPNIPEKGKKYVRSCGGIERGHCGGDFTQHIVLSDTKES